MSNFELTKRLLTRLVDDKFYSGVVLRISNKEKNLLDFTYGCKNLETKEKIKNNDLFQIMSMTKPITVATFLMFMDKGITFKNAMTGKDTKLSLETKVCDVFKAWSKDKLQTMAGEGVQNDITIYHLLTMTSGITYQTQKRTLELLHEWRKNKISYTEFAEKLAQSKLICQPGAKWHYGMGLDLLGAMIDKILLEIDFKYKDKKISKWVDLMKVMIFDELDMKNTYFSDIIPEEETKRVVRTSLSRLTDLGDYTIFDFDKLTHEVEVEQTEELLKAIGDGSNIQTMFGAMMQKPVLMSSLLGRQTNYNEEQVSPLSGSGIISTALDYEKFQQFLLDGKNKNGEVIFNNELLKEMTKNQLTDEQLIQVIKENAMYQNGYGFGLGVKGTKELKNFYDNGTYGWDGMLGSLGLSDRSNNLTIVLMVNTITPKTNVSNKIFDTIYDDIFLGSK